MLFLAVTLGFFVENLREQYIERHRVHQFARTLVDDLAADTVMIRYHVNRMKKFISLTDSLSAYLKNRKLEQIRNFDLFILSTVDRYPPYIWNRATIEQIKNSGSLRYFPQKIIRKIAFYDAYTYHMDDDYKSDEEMFIRASALRNQLIDMDYPSDFWMGLRNNMDSVLKTGYYNEINLNDTLRLITTDLKPIRVFLNEKMNMRKHLIIRSDEELEALIKTAHELIVDVKEEYHIK